MSVPLPSDFANSIMAAASSPLLSISSSLISIAVGIAALVSSISPVRTARSSSDISLHSG